MTLWRGNRSALVQYTSGSLVKTIRVSTLIAVRLQAAAAAAEAAATPNTGATLAAGNAFGNAVATLAAVNAF